MARLNPRRRAFAKQAALLASITNEHGKAHDDSGKMQQGKVNSSMDKFTKSGSRSANQVNMRPLRDGAHAPAWYKDGAKTVYQGHKKGGN